MAEIGAFCLQDCPARGGKHG